MFTSQILLIQFDNLHHNRHIPENTNFGVHYWNMILISLQLLKFPHAFMPLSYFTCHILPIYFNNLQNHRLSPENIAIENRLLNVILFSYTKDFPYTFLNDIALYSPILYLSYTSTITHDLFRHYAFPKRD